MLACSNFMSDFVGVVKPCVFKMGKTPHMFIFHGNKEAKYQRLGRSMCCSECES